MGIIDKMTGNQQSTASNPKYGDSNTQAAPAFEGGNQYGTTQPEKKQGLGEKIKNKLGGDSSSSSSSSDNEGTHGMSRKHHTKRTQEAAPVVSEHVHDQYEHRDHTKVENLTDRTEVRQEVQPVRDEQVQGTQREKVDHGLEVHEHGHGGMDGRAEAELRARREQLAREHGTTHDQSTTERSYRPDVDRSERTNVVEETVPVVDRDVTRPHQIDHEKREVHIEHERPQVTDTHTRAPISASEWESQGHSVSGSSTGYNNNNNSYGDTSTGTGSNQSTGTTNSLGYNDGNTTTTSDNTTHEKKGFVEKVKDKLHS